MPCSTRRWWWSAPSPMWRWCLRLMQLACRTCCRRPTAMPWSRALRLAIERKRLEMAARKAYATDLATGLPNHAQLLEHMTHLVALRAREPAPMALIVLRIEGLASTEASLGAEAANVLKRKVAVRCARPARQRRGGLAGRRHLCGAAGLDRFARRRRARGAQAGPSLTQPFSVTGRERHGGGARRPGLVPRAWRSRRRLVAPRAGPGGVSGHGGSRGPGPCGRPRADSGRQRRRPGRLSPGPASGHQLPRRRHHTSAAAIRAAASAGMSQSVDSASSPSVPATGAEAAADGALA
jgi:hypothetical protein